jgi:hypothetical protein
MSVGTCIILGMTETWTKNTYACDPDECDTLIEITTSDKFGFPSGSVNNVTCPCGRRPNLLSVEPATIAPTIERNEMEQTNTVPDTYNPNLLVTYKSINENDVTYPTIKVNDLEYKLDQVRYTEKQLMKNAGLIGQITDNLSAEGWYNPNTDKEDILRDLCEILGHEPKQTVRITGTISFEVDYDIPLEDVEDFDAHYFLQDTLTLDAYNGDVVVESWTVEDSDVDWNN